MNRKPWHFLRTLLLLCAAGMSLLGTPAQATTADIASTPLGTATGSNVAPNLMFLLDDSGSMAWDYLPDAVGNSSTCKSCSGVSCNMVGTTCSAGMPPFYAPKFNSIYYNSNVTYSAGVNYLNVTLGDQSPTAAKVNPYSSSSSATNLVSGYTDIYWCTTSFPSTAQLADTTVCKRNGINTGNPFTYSVTSGLPDTTFRRQVSVNTAGPHYYTITPREYCSDATLITCTLSTVPTGAFVFPALVRWCSSQAAVEATGAVSGNNITGGTNADCRGGNNPTYRVARLGTFTRVNISSSSSYPKTSMRTDCTGAVGPTGCTGPQELQNFANWYSYYRTRILMMKTVPGRVFGGIGNDPASGPLRAGFVTINNVSSSYLKIDDFKNNTQRQNWFTKLYATTVGSSTPLREALSRVGRHYAGITSGINSGMPDDPMIASCQRNYVMLTTDGYWNGYAGQTLTGGGIGDQDGTPSGTPPIYIDRATTGTLDGINARDVVVTPTTQINEQAVIGTASSTFAAIGGVTSGANQAGSCTSGTGRRVKQRTATYNSTVTFTNGVAGAAVISGVTYSFADLEGCPSTRTAAATIVTTGTSTTTSTPGGTADTLSDVAMYYYKNDLRTTGTFAKNNVPTSGTDIAPHQHMVTFTMGLGLDGEMTYQSDYDTATTGDFFKIKSNATTCLWTTGTCNWPAAAADSSTAIDDLWHAAVNGRGRYFSAKEPTSAENGVKQTLATINIATGSAAAAATSTPNLTSTNNTLFSTTYRTVDWDGEIRALSIDPTTGILNTVTPLWTAAGQLTAQATATSDTRTIYTFSGAAANKLKTFTYVNLTASEQAYFDNKCIVANWSQCSYIATDATRLAAANSGANLVSYLRGQRGNELPTDTSTGYFRARAFLLGDTVDAKPAFMGPPVLLYGDAVTPDYGTFRTANATRQSVLFVASNDGMLHAFNSTTGAEMWAYIPKMVMPNLYRLADASYSGRHTYLVDGSPTLSDVFIGGAWKTVLVGGLNAGGRGYYALDVTDPVNPKALWEICSDPTLCAISDLDMGLSYGVPIIGKRPTDGKWVAMLTSGYNNIGTGNGGGYIYVLDIATGAALNKVGTTISGTNVGNTTTPSGIAQIAGYVVNQVVDNTISVVYGGDLLGNMWRFDLTTATPTIQRIAQLKDGGGRPQSITTQPEVTHFNAGFNAVYIGSGRYLGATDIPDPATLPTPQPWAYQQTIYAFKDPVSTDLGNLRSAGLVQQTINVIDAVTRSASNSAVNWATNNGWFVDLNPVCVISGCSAGGESPGERVNINVSLVRGTLTVVTNEPNSDTCSAGGDSWLYQFDYKSGSYIPGTSGGIVGGKIGNTLAVGIVVFQTLSGQMKSVITAADGSLPQVPISTAGGGGAPKRAAWRELLDTRSSTSSTDIP